MCHVTGLLTQLWKTEGSRSIVQSCPTGEDSEGRGELNPGYLPSGAIFIAYKANSSANTDAK